MQSTTYFYSLILSFFVGVSISSLADIDVAVVGFVGVLAIAIFLYWLTVRTNVVLLASLVFVMIVLGMGRFTYGEYRVDLARDTYNAVETQEFIEGTVVSEVLEKETTQRFTIDTGETRIVVTADRFPSIFYGETLRLTGEVLEPESFETDTGRIFDYPQYLAARRVTHQMFRPEIEIIGSGGGNFVTRNLFEFKNFFLDRVRAVIPEPHVSLLGGLVVGSQEAMGDKLIEAFRITGIIHIVVLSGYNVTIVAESIMRVLGFLSKKWQAVFGVLGIALFAILTGATATIIRASIMALLVILAKVTGRTYEIVRALVVTAFLMVLYNPYVLLFDPSFQLSFLATLGLILVVPHLERIFSFLKGLPKMQSFVLATIATQIFVLPLLLYQVGMLSVVSLIVNVLVLPVVPTVMLFGLLTGLAGFVSTAVSVPVGFISYGILEYILKIVEWFAAIPFAAVSVPQISGWAVVAIYGVYGVILWKLARISRQTSH